MTRELKYCCCWLLLLPEDSNVGTASCGTVLDLLLAGAAIGLRFTAACCSTLLASFTTAAVVCLCSLICHEPQRSVAACLLLTWLAFELLKAAERFVPAGQGSRLWSAFSVCCCVVHFTAKQAHTKQVNNRRTFALYYCLVRPDSSTHRLTSTSWRL